MKVKTYMKAVLVRHRLSMGTRQTPRVAHSRAAWNLKPNFPYLLESRAAFCRPAFISCSIENPSPIGTLFG